MTQKTAVSGLLSVAALGSMMGGMDYDGWRGRPSHRRPKKRVRSRDQMIRRRKNQIAKKSRAMNRQRAK